MEQRGGIETMRHLNYRRILLASAAFATSFGYAQTTWAQAAAAEHGTAAAPISLEELVVTARRRSENLQTTPVAITAVSAAGLEAHNVVNLGKISEFAPNLTVYHTSGSLGASATYMRGVGFADLTLGQDAPIAMYIDGVFNGRATVGDLDLVAPERVEVLRGPQGTLFGRNTTGGAISVTTRTPGDEFGGQASASYGSFGAIGFQARLDSGLLGNTGIKLVGSYQHRQENGYIDNKLQPDNNDPGATKSDSYWGKAVGNWGKFSATLSADYSEITGAPNYLQIVAASPATLAMLAASPGYGGGAYTVTANPQYTVPNLATTRQQRVWDEGVAATFNYEVNDMLSLKSITAVRGYKRNDPSPNGPADLRVNTGTVLAPVITSFNGIYTLDPRQSRQHQYSEEVQALGKIGDFDYVVGGFYFYEKGWEYGFTRLPVAISAAGTGFDSKGLLDYHIVDKSIAGFGQVNYRPSFLDKKLELSGGLRYTEDTKDLNQLSKVVRSPDLKNSNLSVLASANYQWTRDIMTYVRYSTGYRAGGFNVRAAAPAAGGNPIYGPEKMTSYEGGFKVELFDRRFRLNGAAFYNKYLGLQVTQFAPAVGGGPGGSTAFNADANYKGFELEAQAVPVEGLTLSGSVGYVDSQYDHFPLPLLAGGALNAGCTAIMVAAVKVGQDCAAVAKFGGISKVTASAGIAYVLPRTSYGEWSIRADYSYKTRRDFDTFAFASGSTAPSFAPQVAGGAYGVFSGRIALSDIPLSGATRAQLSVYGENLSDERYVLQGIDFGFMGTQVFAKPRSFGASLKVNF
jgi:iron complex outermembrane receptor protein